MPGIPSDTASSVQVQAVPSVIMKPIGARDIPTADGIEASAPAMDRDRIAVIRATDIPAADGIAASAPALDRDRIRVIRAE